MIKLLETYGEDDNDLADKVKSFRKKRIKLVLVLKVSILIDLFIPFQILRTLLAEFNYSSGSLSKDERNELRRILPEIKKKYGEDSLSKSEWEELENHLNS